MIRLFVDVRIEIKIDVLCRNQVDRHVVAVLHLLAQNQVVAQAFNAVVSLYRRLLGDDKLNASRFQASYIAAQQVVSHQVEIRASVTLHVFPNDVSLRIERNATFHRRVCSKNSSSSDASSPGCLA